MWFRYKHKWASGIDTEWSYMELPSNYPLPSTKEAEWNFIEDYNLCAVGDWSDKYRGIDHDIIKAPPKEWLDKKINILKSGIKRIHRKVERLQKLSDSLAQ